MLFESEEELRLVWNRSLFDQSDRLGPGDRALGRVLIFDELVANGGLDYAFEVEDPENVGLAAAAFEYFGISRVPALLARGAKILELYGDSPEGDAPFDELQLEYESAVPDGEFLTAAIRHRYARSGTDFAPLTSHDRAAYR